MKHDGCQAASSPTLGATTARDPTGRSSLHLEHLLWMEVVVEAAAFLGDSAATATSRATSFLAEANALKEVRPRSDACGEKHYYKQLFQLSNLYEII